MKYLFYGLFAFALAACIGVMVANDPGYALLGYGHWTLEMPLWFMALVMFLLFFLFVFFWKLFRSTSSLPRRFLRWTKHRRFRHAQRITRQGLIQLAEGSWSQAERYLVEGAKYSVSPLINYLAAARAAHEQNAYKRRDDYLRLAHKTTPRAKIAVGLTQAECQLSHGQLEQGLATLRHLRTMAPGHPHVLKLLKTLYVTLQDWKSLLQLIPMLRQHKVLTKEEMNQLLVSAYQGRLKALEEDPQGTEILALWQQIPKSLKQDPIFIKLFCEKLMHRGLGDKAEPILRDAIKHQWDSDLVELYGLVEGQDSNKQLAQAEQWLKHHRNNPVLFLTLGRLCIRNQLWGKAKAYLDLSKNLHKKSETLGLLGELCERLGNTADALKYYREGLGIVQ